MLLKSDRLNFKHVAARKEPEAGFNLNPGVEIWPLGVKLAPRVEVGPQGWTLFPRGEDPLFAPPFF
jgi:hypothetical protein